jgi:GDP-D-mannose dehydratase
VNYRLRKLGITISWKGEGENEVGIDDASGKEIISN